jgi:hypothetical protein
VLHRQDCQLVPVMHGRYLAERIPGAMLIELPGTELTLFWETLELALDHVEQFLTGVGRAAQPTRVLATVLFTDIVGSTQRAGKLGDRRWRELLNVHDELTRRLVEEFGGRLVKTTRKLAEGWPRRAASSEFWRMAWIMAGMAPLPLRPWASSSRDGVNHGRPDQLGSRSMDQSREVLLAARPLHSP